MMKVGESIHSNGVTITKTKEAQPIGIYKETEVDRRKKEVDILLINVSPNIVDSKVALKGRGIEPLDSVEGRFRVTDKALDKLQAEHTWATDF